MSTTTVERPNGVHPAAPTDKQPTKRQLAAQVRAAEREQKRRERDRLAQQRVAARKFEREGKAMRRKAEAAARQDRRKSRCVILPEKAKITQAASKDDTRPHLQHALIVREGRGPKARWVLVATDSYQMMVLPLEVTDPNAIRKAIVTPEALKAIEQAGAFRIHRGKLYPVKVRRRQKMAPGTGIAQANGMYSQPIWFDGLDVEPTGVSYQLHAEGKPPFRFPDYKSLAPKPPAKTRHFEVTLNATLLRQLATAMGEGGSGKTSGTVSLVFDLGKATRTKDGRRVNDRHPIIVEADGSGGEGALMPVRRHV